jgi:hypothetical protein
MVSRSRVSVLGLALSTVLLAQACAQPSRSGTGAATREQCERRIIVSFAAAPDAGTIAAVAAAARVQLAVVSRLLPDTYVLDLSSAGQDAACDAGLARVRADGRVRAADPDTRRAAH